MMMMTISTQVLATDFKPTCGLTNGHSLTTRVSHCRRCKAAIRRGVNVSRVLIGVDVKVWQGVLTTSCDVKMTSVWRQHWRHSLSNMTRCNRRVRRVLGPVLCPQPDSGCGRYVSLVAWMIIMQLGQTQPGFANRSLAPVESGWKSVTTVRSTSLIRVTRPGCKGATTGGLGGSGPPKFGRTIPTFYGAANCSARNWV